MRTCPRCSSAALGARETRGDQKPDSLLPEAFDGIFAIGFAGIGGTESDDVPELAFFGAGSAVGVESPEATFVAGATSAGFSAGFSATFSTTGAGVAGVVGAAADVTVAGVAGGSFVTSPLLHATNIETAARTEPIIFMNDASCGRRIL